ncbi:MULTISPECIES: DUF7519 family protein [Halorussus]|uniref:DUF7519 family protein n=1 Tax=Halorussus TaxID=1070314 RepID=UPI00209DAEB9|nr:hypothetical protein [Halorussus vallis]USZ77073.1 hypothetical protein NGM07_07035 [Halorussus vallis]
MTASGAVSKRPTLAGSVLAIAAALASVRFVASGSGQLPPLALAAVAAGIFGVGAAVRERDQDFLGWAFVALGALAAVGAVGYAWSAPPSFSEKVVVLPGVVGVAFVAAALVPVRAGWERRLLGVGLAWLAICVMAAVIMQEATKIDVLWSMAAAILSWDAGKNAVSLGQQVGRGARTWTVEAVHGGASFAVALLAVVGAVGVYDLNVTGVSLAALALLLGGAISLAVALYN